jgi:hypothetical protein
MMHLSDCDSPKITFEVTNPGYISPTEIVRLRKLEAEGKLLAETFISSVDEMIADAKALYGDNIYNPTYLMPVNSLAYCGETLKRTAKSPPEFLWTCDNYSFPADLLNCKPNEICWDCVDRLDVIRNKQGYRPVMDKLRNPDDCDCAMWVLQQKGCKCGKK